MGEPAKHLDLETLARFAAGAMDDETFQTVAEHLSGCEDCFRLAEALPEDPLAVRLRAAFAATRSQDPACLPTDAGVRLLPVAANSGSTPVTEDFEPAPVLRVPGYEILTPLGSGGMGDVHLARDTRLKRRVALKVIRGALTTKRLARFQAEAEVIARLNHPNIIQIYEIGQCPADPSGPGLHYLALEYAPGESLDRRLKRRRPTPREAAHLVAVVARAVHAAHQAGIVHRDLKPANVLLADSVEGASGNTVFGFPKVSDFGLARLMDSLETPVHPTATGAILGTPSYMPPEQANGDNRSVGPAADVYALGAILYECLTGKPPFRGNAWLDVLVRVAFETPTPPSQIVEGVPSDLERICLTCLNKSPDDRYASAAALADDLLRFLDGQSPLGQGIDSGHPRKKPTFASVDPDSPTEVVASPVGQLASRLWRRPLYLAAAVVALCLAGAAVWTLWPAAATPAPLKGSIDVTVTKKSNPQQALRLADPGALPLALGDEVRVEAELNRPAWVYIVWIDTTGKALPVYPWREGKRKSRPAREKPVKRLSLPEQAGEVWGIDPGPPGLETLLLLARETPLPKDVDLEAALAGLRPEKMEDPRDMAWFENGLLVLDEERKGRAANLKSRPSRNPVVRINAALQERVGRYFSYTRAVTFANHGGEEK
jgi:serine/threonine protein kinase